MEKNNGIPIESERDLLIKLATDIKYIKESIDDIKELQGNLDDRIDNLEQWRAYILGFAAAIACVVSFLVSLLWRS